MSILNDLVRDVASLLFPPRCAVCGEPLARGERTVCTLCRVTAPLTGYWREADNPVVRRCWGMVPVCQASGFLFFVRASGWRRLIHGFKYRGAWRTARAMGDSALFIKQRHVRNCSYADPEYGKGVAKALGIDYEEALKAEDPAHPTWDPRNKK